MTFPYEHSTPAVTATKVRLILFAAVFTCRFNCRHMLPINGSIRTSNRV